MRAKEGGRDKTGETLLKDPSPLFFPLPVVPCTSSPGTRVSRSPLSSTNGGAGGVGHIFYADINYRTCHVLLLCGRVVYLASLQSNLNNNLPTLFVVEL